MKKTVVMLMLAVIFLMALGFVMLITLHVAHSGGPHRHLLPANLITWQILGAGVGLVMMFEVARVDYRRWQTLATRFAASTLRPTRFCENSETRGVRTYGLAPMVPEPFIRDGAPESLG